MGKENIYIWGNIDLDGEYVINLNSMLPLIFSTVSHG